MPVQERRDRGVDGREGLFDSRDGVPRFRQRGPAKLLGEFQPAFLRPQLQHLMARRHQYNQRNEREHRPPGPRPPSRAGSLPAHLAVIRVFIRHPSPPS